MAGEQLTPEEILAQLKTRGFETGFQRTPLREFWGTLVSVGGSMVDRFIPPRLEILYNFEDMEVILSTEPYPSPVAQITVLNSNREQSAMGILGASIDKILNVGLPDTVTDEESGTDIPNPAIRSQDALMGKRQHWKMTGGHMMWDGKQGKETARETWEVIEVEGEGVEEAPPEPAKPVAKASAPKAPAAQSKVVTKGGVKKTPVQAAMELLDGKTEQQFYSDAFSNPIIRADNKLRDQMIKRQFIQPLVDAGTISKDVDGVFHVN